MAESNEFEKYCIQTLEIHFGQLAGGIVNKIKIKKSLNEKSNISDLKEFIDLIEINISILAGKNKANEIGNTLRSKALDYDGKQKKSGSVLTSDMEKEIDTFLVKNSLPTEKDVAEYTKYLTLKYGGIAKNVEKEIIEKIKIHIKKTISHKRVKEEINDLLIRFHEPTKNDIDDFINYIRLSKLDFQEDELRDEIEKERLYRKFHGPQDTAMPSEINELVNLIKNTNNNDALSKKLRKQELSYLIKDESGISDKSVSEFVNLMTPSEEDTKDTLEGLGLKHLIHEK
ncbi:MAG: hypothetical protein C3F06_13425 [Candidatus Methanoperedenaceae archaeon]|nr:MAG: hypothetical protein C3F06_13425 [Candidatus Methanoperedenaceae archaeon]